MAKVQISIPDDLLEKVDRYCKYNYISRSGLVSIACNQYVNQNEMINAINELSVAFKRAVDENDLNNNELLEKVKDFESVAKVFANKV